MILFDYYEKAKEFANEYGVKTQQGFDWLLYDLKEIYNHQFPEGFEVVIQNLQKGAYDDPSKGYKSVFEYEMELRT